MQTNPPELRFGPKIIDFPDGDEKIDLDSVPPLILDKSTRGTDIGVDVSNADLDTLDGDPRLAPLPSSGSEPSEAECVKAVETNGTYNVDLTKGTRYCAVSGEGRTTYLRAVAVPTEGTIRLEVTVWEIPG
ncbi:hypothetical protein ABZ569_25185 [Streptomyces albus]|uniref:hypothetical protein n=1 Tax=Streptomyces albus TaxID=1888 RepID=UPI0033F91E9E